MKFKKVDLDFIVMIRLLLHHNHLHHPFPSIIIAFTFDIVSIALASGVIGSLRPFLRLLRLHLQLRHLLLLHRITNTATITTTNANWNSPITVPHHLPPPFTTSLLPFPPHHPLHSSPTLISIAIIVHIAITALIDFIHSDTVPIEVAVTTVVTTVATVIIAITASYTTIAILDTVAAHHFVAVVVDNKHFASGCIIAVELQCSFGSILVV